MHKRIQIQQRQYDSLNLPLRKPMFPYLVHSGVGVGNELVALSGLDSMCREEALREVCEESSQQVKAADPKKEGKAPTASSK